MSPRNKKNSKNDSSNDSLFSSIFNKPKKKRGPIFKIQVVLIVIILILVAYLFSYWIGNGFSIGDNIVGTDGGFYLKIDNPHSGAVYNQGEVIKFTGGSMGGTLRQAILWDDAHNVGVPCNVVGTRFSVSIPGERLSPGLHTLVVQGQGVDGGWSQKTSVDIKIMESGPGGDTTMDFGEHPLSEDQPEGLFAPIQDIWNGIIGQAEQGTGDNDLNGDNVDDRLQASFLSPRHNPFNLPLMVILLAVIIAILVALILYYAYNYHKRKQDYKQKMAENISSKKATREWYLKLAALPLSFTEVGKKLKQTRLEKAALEKNLQSAKSKLAHERVNLSSKIARLDERRKTLLAKQKMLMNDLKQNRYNNVKSIIDPRRVIGRPGNRLEAVDGRKNVLSRRKQLNDKRHEMAKKLAEIRYRAKRYDIEQKKLRARKNRLQYEEQYPEDERGINWFDRQIKNLKYEQDRLSDTYNHQLELEKMKRRRDQETFKSILKRLEKEKERLKEEKQVNIMVKTGNGSNRERKLPLSRFRKPPKNKER
jgi:flagellar basal body-associated protein FliL